MPAARSAGAAGTSVPSAVAYLTLAHQREGAVGERREIARTTQTAVLAHNRRDAGVDHRCIGGRGLRADTSAAGCQGRQPQQHQCPDDLALDLGPGPGGMAADQAALQLGAEVRRDVARCQRSEARGDAVIRHVGHGEVLDNLAALRDLGQRLTGELDAYAVPCDVDHVGGRERTRSDRYDDTGGWAAPIRITDTHGAIVNRRPRSGVSRPPGPDRRDDGNGRKLCPEPLCGDQDPG